MTNSIRAISLALLIGFTTSAAAYEYGPFTLRGFAKLEGSQASNQCPDCSEFPDEDRQRSWADELADDAEYETTTGTLSLFQPYLGTQQFHLGQGFRASGLLSQRWRDGKQDIDGVWYEMNAMLRHEYYGFLQVGAFPTRGWSVADYPHGSLVGVADAWGSSGSGYGLLTRAIRYAFPLFDVAGGDLYAEYSYDIGAPGYTVHKPQFHEIYLQYVRGQMVVDFIYQYALNGLPSSWTHGPFRGLTAEAKHEDTEGLEENEQSIALLMFRDYLTSTLELFLGVRHNRWSGNSAVIVGTADNGDFLWNNMFNVDWDGELNGVSNPGYPASSTDGMFGLRYTHDHQWSFSTGTVYLGVADTDNPEERGQSNAMWLTTVGAGYKLRHDWNVYGFGGYVNFKEKGLAPLSMPAHSSFTGVDSRVKTHGNWAGAGIEYVF